MFGCVVVGVLVLPYFYVRDVARMNRSLVRSFARSLALSLSSASSSSTCAISSILPHPLRFVFSEKKKIGGLGAILIFYFFTFFTLDGVPGGFGRWSARAPIKINVGGSSLAECTLVGTCLLRKKS